MKDPSPLMTPGEVAGAFHVSVITVTRYANEGKLLSRRTLGNQRRFARAEVAALLRGESPGAARKLGQAQLDELAAAVAGGT